MLSVRIEVARMVTVEYLLTYENIGSVAVWFDDLKDEGVSIVNGGFDCTNLTSTMQQIPDFVNPNGYWLWWNPSMAGVLHPTATNGTEFGYINGRGKENTSTIESQIIGVEEVYGPSNETLVQQKWMHFCLPKDQKFKVLSLSCV